MFFLRLKKFAALVLFVGLVFGFSQAQAMKDDKMKGNSDFMTMDKDHNKSLSWDEVNKHYPQMEKKAFHDMDINKDEHISNDEWKSHMNETNDHKRGM